MKDSPELERRVQNWIESFSEMQYLEGSCLPESLTIDIGGEA